jgi:outer membrane lipoprotein-sorting protein
MKKTTMTTCLSILLPLSLAVLVSTSALAETAEEKGLAIAKEADKRDTGWKDMTAQMKMILKNKQGQVSTREIRIRSMEVNNDGDKSMSIFDTPPDVKGTAFLSYTHALEADDQWLYLPALKRVKRISSRNKSGPFMGSEFAYEDIASQEVAKYTYKFIKEDTIDGRKAFVVERYPAYKYSGYTKTVAWIDEEMYMPLKIDFYDRKQQLLKTLTPKDYKQYLGKYYRASSMTMDNHVSHKSTTLEWSNYKFDNGLTDRDFDRNSLKRAR